MTDSTSRRPLADKAHLIAVARGEAAPDLVIEGARVFCAFTCEWLDCDVAVARGQVAGIGGPYSGGRRIDGAGRYLVPGLIDSHVHIESSLLTPAQFARTVVPHGTTTVIAEPHEIANVLGVRGVEWFFDACEGLPLDIFVMVPSCVPASHFESPFEPLGRADIEALLQHPRALGIGEMMNFPGVIAAVPSELDKLLAAGSTHADGHAPGVRGADLDAYIGAGIGSDHESTTVAEARDKLRRGMWVLLREASNAHNLVDLAPLVREHGTERCALCTDDREPVMLLEEGHINQMCRLLVEAGVAAEQALQMATLRPAEAHGLTDRGAIAPGMRADMALLPDLRRFEPELVISEGRVVFDESGMHGFADPEVPAWVRSSMSVAEFDAATLAIDATGVDEVRVIDIVPGQLLTGHTLDAPTVHDGQVVADPERDLAKIAVVERHHATGRVGLGLVRGFGLTRGAFASTVAHDAHNVVVVGVDDFSMATCVERLVELGGGLVVADGTETIAELPLPVGGLMSERGAADVVASHNALTEALAGLGVTSDAPFMTVSFLALSVIPSLKITDRGLIDVDRFENVPLGVPSSSRAEAGM